MTVFSLGRITATGDLSLIDGSYGSSPTQSYTGLSGTANNVDASTAEMQLVDLYNYILTHTGSLATPSSPLPTTLSGPQTFYPNTYYHATSFTATNQTMTFDAMGDSNAEFFIIVDSDIAFTTCGFVVGVNGSQANNIYWIAGAHITVSGLLAPTTTLPGNFIVSHSVDQNTTSILTISTVNSITGRLYAHYGAITTTNSTPISINANYPSVPISPPSVSWAIHPLKLTKVLWLSEILIPPSIP
jgi:hypothetical protein